MDRRFLLNSIGLAPITLIAPPNYAEFNVF